ncbi:hypothetical protein BGAPBR_I0030 (plasmid) [Borreliella garinii PBr]|uniref:Uncharacterized protein n=1 Tax=Borreliella garinii PBr TaxID=498743 RepID=B8F109_BORGR|nr:hypothetical protein BGAPBR_I0030 [Borreliella garinii PBr]
MYYHTNTIPIVNLKLSTKPIYIRYRLKNFINLKILLKDLNMNHSIYNRDSSSQLI